MATDKLVDFDHVTDYISREAVLELIDNAPIIAGNENETLISAPKLSDEVYCIPAADVRPVAKGRWGIDPQCPICGEDRYKDLDADIWAAWEPPFCPNCGAKMDGESEYGLYL